MLENDLSTNKSELITKLNTDIIEKIRNKCIDPINGLWAFQQLIVGPGYPEGNAAVSKIHGKLCEFLNPNNKQYGRFRDVTVPRSFFKTATCSILFPLWYVTCVNINTRFLIVCNKVGLAERIIHSIKSIVEGNSIYRECFPEAVPDNRKVRWSSRLAELGKGTGLQEGNWTAAGTGGGAVSLHFDIVMEDDLIYPKKDDFSGEEIMPDQNEIDQAIGFHKFNTSLFVDPNKSMVYNIGTRFAPRDLKQYIKDNEPYYSRFHMASEYNKDGSIVNVPLTGEPTWPERYDIGALEVIKQNQGTWMYCTQYLNIPQDSSKKVFDSKTLRLYDDYDQTPKNFKNIRTIIDLAGWNESKNTRSAYNVIATFGLDDYNHVWLLNYSRGNFNPSQVYEKITHHAQWIYDKWKKTPDEAPIYIEEIYDQEAMRHVANILMQQKGQYFTLRKLDMDNTSNAKDIRIRRIEAVASAGGLHIKSSMKEFIEEFDEYPLSISKDLLDVTGWFIKQMGINMMDIIQNNEDSFNKIKPFVITTDEVIDEIEKKSKKFKKSIPTGLRGYDFDERVNNREWFNNNYYGNSKPYRDDSVRPFSSGG